MTKVYRPSIGVVHATKAIQPDKFWVTVNPFSKDPKKVILEKDIFETLFVDLGEELSEESAHFQRLLAEIDELQERVGLLTNFIEKSPILKTLPEKTQSLMTDQVVHMNNLLNTLIERSRSK